MPKTARDVPAQLELLCLRALWSLEEGKGPLAAHVLRRGNPHRR